MVEPVSDASGERWVEKHRFQPSVNGESPKLAGGSVKGDQDPVLLAWNSARCGEQTVVRSHAQNRN